MMSFIYVNCGKSLNPERPHVCPYSANKDEIRIFLSKRYSDQNLFEQIHESNKEYY